MIQNERVRTLNRKRIRQGRYVLYWMQASVRGEYNHALEYAIREANGLNQPLLVFFGITETFPEANERHYYFMLEGLRETQLTLRERGIQLVIWKRSPEVGVAELAKDASLVVVDGGYVRIQREWRDSAAERIGCSLVQVESDAVVPVEEASPKEEYSAATFRPKINRKLDYYLLPLEETSPQVDSLGLDVESFDVSDVEEAISRLDVDRSVPRVDGLHGGMQAAKRRLEEFLREKLDLYPELRNDPTQDYLSGMSPYLHFGQISPLYIALRVRDTDSPGKDAYLEELIVRRELSLNFVHYNDRYDSLQALPSWVRKTLGEHEADPREYVYGLADFEGAATHDPYWNAAQKEMAYDGKMHGYMRMYWGKKILEWTENPADALRIALYLNNKYELDGRDPNGFTGVAWCLGKHDRPWGERAVFGKVRYMSSKGLRRKFDADAYVRKVESVSEGQD
ncbi:MAG: deoxyribodipyrimidine photolyase [Anaerolineae bacterium]|nr:deoxyribodipyrimidine photolyase [Anaerolineae bacterium]NIN97951.1 deoxyribodipyrimidine photolyase [Anaerolineae bacterium]NIQ80918.1 deoxyribodipyrimidine photolyase [Anaerolineae bacterium]